MTWNWYRRIREWLDTKSYIRSLKRSRRTPRIEPRMTVVDAARYGGNSPQVYQKGWSK